MTGEYSKAHSTDKIYLERKVSESFSLLFVHIRKSTLCFYSRAGIKPRKIYQIMNTSRLGFLLYAHSSDGKVRKVANQL